MWEISLLRATLHYRVWCAVVCPTSLVCKVSMCRPPPRLLPPISSWAFYEGCSLGLQNPWEGNRLIQTHPTAYLPELSA